MPGTPFEEEVLKCGLASGGRELAGIAERL
jgi:hypothetical protein